MAKAVITKNAFIFYDDDMKNIFKNRVQGMQLFWLLLIGWSHLYSSGMVA